MKLSRIDYIGLNGGDGLHYPENMPESEKAYYEWLAAASNSCYTNLDMWEAAWELAQEAIIQEINFAFNEDYNDDDDS